MKRFLSLLLCLLVVWNGGIGLAFAEQVTYYHTDEAGTPLAISDAAGQQVWAADYKPFGEEFSTTGSAVNDRRFVGKEKDEETGLNYFGARYLAAGTGRLLAPDSVRAVNGFSGRSNPSLLVEPQRLNAYAYSLNNPYRYVDPNGKEVITILTFAGLSFLTLAVVNYQYSQHYNGMSSSAQGVADRINGAWNAFAESNEEQETQDEGGLVGGEADGANTNVEDAIGAIEEYLGENAEARKNRDGDLVIVSEDGNRKIRFDINNPSPHESPHGHVEWKTEHGNWRGPGPIFPKDSTGK